MNNKTTLALAMAALIGLTACGNGTQTDVTDYDLDQSALSQLQTSNANTETPVVGNGAPALGFATVASSLEMVNTGEVEVTDILASENANQQEQQLSENVTINNSDANIESESAAVPEPVAEPIAEPIAASEPVAEPLAASEPVAQPEQNTDLELAAAQSASSAEASSNDLLSQGPLRIFPGAEGFGTKSVGGRGGKVCNVTTLANDGPGSLRNCVEQSGARMVIFKVGGTIEVDSAIKLDDPFISIYGQTAPGDGILLRGSLDSLDSPMIIRSHDVLIQHMRIRGGTSRGITCCRDAISIGSDIPGSVYNVVLDHNSFSWGSDEIVDIWYDTHDITLSYNIVAESLHDNGSNPKGPAGRGLIVGSRGAHSITLHHNLIAHSYQRNPLVKTSGIVDVVNNLVYHHVTRGGQQHEVYTGQKVNWVKNQYIPLEGQSDSAQDTSVLWGDLLVTADAQDPELHLLDNLGYYRQTNDASQLQFAHTDWNQPYESSLGYHSESRFAAPPITETDVEDLETLLPEVVGAILPRRDAADERIMNELKTRSGKMPNCVEQADRPGEERCANNVGGWPYLEGGISEPDTDNDGMPDAWEQANDLNPEIDDASEDANNDGYTNLEQWIYSAQ